MSPRGPTAGRDEGDPHARRETPAPAGPADAAREEPRDEERREGPGGEEVTGRSPRSLRRALRRQWRHGVGPGDRLILVERTVTEDPTAMDPSEVLPALSGADRDAIRGAWERAELALLSTTYGLLGARLALAPVRRRWRSVICAPDLAAQYVEASRWRNPARCLGAARAVLAAQVVHEAALWRAVGRGDVTLERLRDATLAAHRLLAAVGADDEERPVPREGGPGGAPGEPEPDADREDGPPPPTGGGTDAVSAADAKGPDPGGAGHEA
jgi:hypothetical protein